MVWIAGQGNQVVRCYCLVPMAEKLQRSASIAMGRKIVRIAFEGIVGRDQRLLGHAHLKQCRGKIGAGDYQPGAIAVPVRSKSLLEKHDRIAPAFFLKCQETLLSQGRRKVGINPEYLARVMFSAVPYPPNSGPGPGIGIEVGVLAIQGNGPVKGREHRIARDQSLAASLARTRAQVGMAGGVAGNQVDRPFTSVLRSVQVQTPFGWIGEGNRDQLRCFRQFQPVMRYAWIDGHGTFQLRQALRAIHRHKAFATPAQPIGLHGTHDANNNHTGRTDPDSSLDQSGSGVSRKGPSFWSDGECRTPELPGRSPGRASPFIWRMTRTDSTRAPAMARQPNRT